MTIPGAGGQVPPRPDQQYQGSQGQAVVAPGALPVLRANKIIVFGPNDGVFIYAGAPAAGNLLYTVVGAAGTDLFGNATLQGATSYNTAGFFSALSVDGGIITWYTASSQAGPYTAQSSISFSQSGGRGGITLAANGLTQIGSSAGCYWDDAAQVFHVTGGTVATAALTVAGNALTMSNPVSFPATEPTGASTAPASYNQTWGATVVNAIDNLIINLRTNGILN